MSRRENTFRIDYAKVPKKPSYEDLHEFVGTVLGMKREEVKRIQCSKHFGCAFVKASSLEVAQRVVDEHDGKHELEIDEQKYPLRMWMEDGGTDVKLFDLSEDVNDEAITDFMQAYGDILSIRELMWDSKFLFGGVSTGVRVVRMVVKRNIPSSVNIDGETTVVSYNGQNHTCRHCNEFVHSGISCIQNKKLLIQKLQADQLSYANVAKQAGTPKETNNISATTRSHNRPSTGKGQKTSHASSLATLNPKAATDRLATQQKQKKSQLPPQQQQKQQNEMPPPPIENPPPQRQRNNSARSLAETDTPSQQPITSEVDQRSSDDSEMDESTSIKNSSSRRLRSHQPSKKMRHEAGHVVSQN